MILYDFKKNNNNESLIHNINQLPNKLQYKIFIICMKEFWKHYTPLTAKIPSWYYRSMMIRQELLYARIHNIHFMHLSFNTLPESKQWIPGCQCDFCLSDTSTSDTTKQIIKEKILFSIYDGEEYLLNTPFTDSLWNDYLYRIGDTFIKVFDPLWIDG